MARRLSCGGRRAAVRRRSRAIRPERLADLGFTPHPATRIVRSRFCGGDDLRRQPRRGSSGSEIDAGDAEDALITRPEFDVVVRRLPPGGAVFLTA